MRVLLDECLPRKSKRLLTGHTVHTVPEMGWAGIENGPLLRLMESNFDVFVTIDANLQYQQQLGKRSIGTIVLSAPYNTIEDTRPFAPGILSALLLIGPGQLIQVPP